MLDINQDSMFLKVLTYNVFKYLTCNTDLEIHVGNLLPFSKNACNIREIPMSDLLSHQNLMIDQKCKFPCKVLGDPTKNIIWSRSLADSNLI